MLVDTKAIVLRAIHYSDTHSIVHAYTEGHGAVSYWVSRTMRKRSGGLKALFIPLSLLVVTMDYRPNRDLQRVREATLLHVPSRPSIDPVCNAVALFASEFLDKILRESDGDRPLFHFLANEIAYMEQLSPQGLASWHLRLIAALCWKLGVMPDTSTYRLGSVLIPHEGRWEMPTQQSEEEWVEASQLFHTLLTSATPDELAMTQDERNALLALQLRYFEHHYPGMRQLKSPAVLRTLFRS